MAALQNAVADLVYANWVVPVAAVQALVPKHVQIVNTNGVAGKIFCFVVPQAHFRVLREKCI